MSKLEQVLLLEPPGDLKFKGPFTDVVVTNLELKNPSEKTVCFKVKTTAPRRYCVRPNSGVIEPGGTVTISVMLQPFDYDPAEKSKHKFMVQTMFGPRGITDTEPLWRDAKPEELMDSKLRCIFEMPPESETEGRQGVSIWSSVRSSPESIQDHEMKKMVDKCRKLQSEIFKLADENQQLKEDNRMRKKLDAAFPFQLGRKATVPSLLVVIAAIFIGYFFGKFIW